MFHIDSMKVIKNKQPILKIDHLDFHKPELNFVIGPNGAGKTTLLRVLAGLEPYEGHIFFRQQECRKVNKRQFATEVAWMPSASYPSFDLRVQDLLQLGRYPWHQGFPQEKDRLQIEKALSTLQIEHLSLRLVSSLSSGEYQKVQIARALAGEARCLILDEPCSHLDIGARLEFCQILKELGMMTIMSSHDHFLAHKFADRCICIKAGTVFNIIAGKPELTDIAELFSVNPAYLT